MKVSKLFFLSVACFSFIMGAITFVRPVPVDTAMPVIDVVSPVVRTYAQQYHISEPLTEVIMAAAMKYNIPRPMAFRLVWAESRFYSDAQSPKGAIGLSQVLPSTAKGLHSNLTRYDLFDPEINMNTGFEYLAYLRRRYKGNWAKALYAYNHGPRAADSTAHVMVPYVLYILEGK